MKERKGELVFSILLAIFFSIMLYDTTRFRKTASSVIGPEFWPRIILSCTVVLSILLIVRILKNKGTVSTKEENNKVKPINFWIILAISVAYIIVLPVCGSFISTLLFLVIILWIFHTKKLKQLIPLSLSFAIALMLLFPKLLGVPLPRGIGIFRTISLWFY